MYKIIGYRHKEGKDYGKFQDKSGKEQSYDNILLFLIDEKPKASEDIVGSKVNYIKIATELIQDSYNEAIYDLNAIINKVVMISTTERDGRQKVTDINFIE